MEVTQNLFHTNDRRSRGEFGISLEALYIGESCRPVYADLVRVYGVGVDVHQIQETQSGL